MALKCNLTAQERMFILNYLKDDILPQLEDDYHLEEKIGDKKAMNIIIKKSEAIEKIMKKL